MGDQDNGAPQIDEIDRGLIRLLQENGRMSTCRMAAELDCLSDRAVRYRLDRLQHDDLIRVSAIVCTTKLGWPVMGDVLLDIVPWKLGAIVQQLWTDDRVCYIAASPDKRQVSFQTNGRDHADLMRVVGEITADLDGLIALRVAPLSRLFRDVTGWMPSGESVDA
jgi:Lrp/AsnC family transcriptional regulator for asnA, asnC and gidA